MGQYQDPIVGTVLDGRYRVVEPLGHGGMGSVYLAEDTRLRRRCALKVLHPHLMHDRSNVDRFLREAQTIAQLEHPHIVDIFSFGEEPNGVVFFAMELLTGEDLDARIRSGNARPYSPYEACVWGIQIARALTVVHDNGLIHRDLKASNIFLTRRRDGEEIIKLLDFGIARPEAGSELTATGTFLGTPAYMAPEQFESRMVDRRVDIYAFGVLLFKLLTGQVPFGGDVYVISKKHREDAPPLPTQVAPDAGVTPPMEQIILTALAKHADDRYQSMRAVEEALIAVLEAEAPELLPGVVRSPRPSTLSTIPPRRQPTSPHPAPTPINPAVQPSDATPVSTANRTGPTSALSARAESRSNRVLLAVTGGSLLVAAVLLTVAATRGDGAPTNEPLPPPVKVAQAPAVEPLPAPQPTKKPVTPPVSPPPASDPRPEDTSTKVTSAVTDTPPSEPPDESKPVVKSPPLDKPPPKKVDPVDQVKRKAAACRKQHKAGGGQKITLTFEIDDKGVTADITPSVTGELGECMKQAVAGTRFEPKFVAEMKLVL